MCLFKGLQRQITCCSEDCRPDLSCVVRLHIAVGQSLQGTWLSGTLVPQGKSTHVPGCRLQARTVVARHSRFVTHALLCTPVATNCLATWLHSEA